MTSLVNATFAEWTDGLDTRESMISIFSHIRDIPYFLMAPVPNHITSAEQLLITGRGSCGPKHYLLAEMFRKLNLSVVFATIAFSWDDPDLPYPPRLREIAARLPITHHLACRVQVGCRWILVDATWDPPLAKAGFPVNDRWDGYSETRCAVKPLNSPVRGILCTATPDKPYREKNKTDLYPIDEEKVHWIAADREQYYCEKVAVRTLEERKQIVQFYHDFDAWLIAVRKKEYQI
jgi:hypothetical protein